MDITSPLFLAILANGPVKVDRGILIFLYGGKVRKCKSNPGTQKIQNRGREANHGPIHGSPQNVENLQTGYRRLTNMANRGPGERGFQERLFIPFNQRRVPTPRQRSMGIQNFPFFFGNTRSPRHHRHGTQRVDGHFELGKRHRLPESKRLGPSVRGLFLRHATTFSLSTS